MKRSIGFYIKISIVAVAVLVGVIHYVCDNYKWWFRTDPKVVEQVFLDSKEIFNDVKDYLLSAHIKNVIYYDDIDSYDIDPAIAEKMKKILGNLHFLSIESCIEVDSSKLIYISFYHHDSAGIQIIFLLDEKNPLCGGDVTDLGEGWYVYDFFEV